MFSGRAFQRFAALGALLPLGAFAACAVILPWDELSSGARGDGGGESSTLGDGPNDVVCESQRKACGGACVTLDSDSANCGECGVDCGRGSECHEGRCDPATVAKIDNGGCHMVAISEDGNVAYVTTYLGAAGLRAVRLNDATITELAVGAPHENAAWLERVGSTLFFSEAYKPGAVYSLDLTVDAAAPVAIAGTFVAPFGLLVSDSTVYWANTAAGEADDAGSIGAASLIDGGSGLLASGLNHPNALAEHGGSIYFTTGNASATDGRIYRVAKDGGTPELVRGKLANPWGVAVLDDELYFTNAAGLSKLALTAGGKPIALPADEPIPLGSHGSEFNGRFVLVTPNAKFWTARSPKGVASGGVWYFTNTESGALMTGLAEPVGLALDRGFLYVCANVGLLRVRLPKKLLP